MTTLNGSRIVVLGGTRGIGFAVAKRAAEERADVTVVSGKRSSVETAIEEIPGAKGRAIDLSDVRAIEGFFADAGPIDHLVYTAGEHLLLGPIGELDLVAARKFFDVRYWGALASVRAVRKSLRRSIVLSGGLASRRPPPGFAIGASICGAMESLTRALALELAPVRVNIVIPGFVETDLWSNFDEATRTQMFRDAAAKLPVRRIGTADDIAEHYLAFMRGGYTTGQSIIVDGGNALV